MNYTTATKIRAVLEAGPLSGHDITYLLGLCGYTQTRLASELKLSKPTVHAAIYGHESSFNVATKIASILGTTPERLWPGRYVYAAARYHQRAAA